MSSKSLCQLDSKLSVFDLSTFEPLLSTRSVLCLGLLVFLFSCSRLDFLLPTLDGTTLDFPLFPRSSGHMDLSIPASDLVAVDLPMLPQTVCCLDFFMFSCGSFASDFSLSLLAAAHLASPVPLRSLGCLESPSPALASVASEPSSFPKSWLHLGFLLFAVAGQHPWKQLT